MTAKDLHRKRDRERKQLERKLNTPYAQRVRVSKRSEKSKIRRRELRQRPEQKEKERLYMVEYRTRTEVITKNKARYAANIAIQRGIIKRPDKCENCETKDVPLLDGRSGLRADHYLGYQEENYLKVKFICLKCDGTQLRKNYE